MLFQSAGDELSSRDLLYKPSFLVVGYSWDVFTEDPADATETNPGFPPPIVNGLDRIPNTPAYATAVASGTKLSGGVGLPVCYDPMWWYQVGSANGFGIVSPFSFRFGSGIGHIRPDPSDSGPPSAWGLQRISNFPLLPTFNIDPSSIFASPDDIVMQTDGTQPRLANGAPDTTKGRGSPIVPDLSQSSLQVDYSYTWMFTGKQTDVSNGTIFDGDIVIFHNRPFAIETINGQQVAAGETTIEAIWGYGAGYTPGTSFPYNANDRSVLLRWPVTQADPDVRVGGYIADVTYERFSSTEVSRFYNTGGNNVGWSTYYPAQRCYWYRVAKKTDVTSSQPRTGDSTSYREMTVTVASPLRAKTPLGASNTTGGIPLVVNAALVCPYVVNVVPKVVYTR
jgi:hypothetical protein